MGLSRPAEEHPATRRARVTRTAHVAGVGDRRSVVPPSIGPGNSALARALEASTTAPNQGGAESVPRITASAGDEIRRFVYARSERPQEGVVKIDRLEGAPAALQSLAKDEPYKSLVELCFKHWQYYLLLPAGDTDDGIKARLDELLAAHQAIPGWQPGDKLYGLAADAIVDPKLELMGRTRVLKEFPPAAASGYPTQDQLNDALQVKDKSFASAAAFTKENDEPKQQEDRELIEFRDWIAATRLAPVQVEDDGNRIGRVCKGAISFHTAGRQQPTKVRFELSTLETHNVPLKDAGGLAGTSITARELRYIFRAFVRQEAKVQSAGAIPLELGQITYYLNGREVEAPSEHDPDLWASYKARVLNRPARPLQ